MPTDKKKYSSGKQGPVKKPSAKQLHANAKEFVPSSATPKATVASWRQDDASKKPASPAAGAGSGKAPPAKNGAAAPKPAASMPSAAEAAKKSATSAWGSKPSDAIKKAAPIKPQQQNKPAGQRRQQQQQHQHGRGGGGGHGKRGSGKQGGGGGNSGGGSWMRAAAQPGSAGGIKDGNRRQQESHGNNGPGGDHGDRGNDSNSIWMRGKALPVELMKPGEGKTDAEKAVKRINVEDLFAMRLNFVAPPSSWEGEGNCKPPAACLWDDPARISEIEEMLKTPRIGGDVSRREKRKDGGGGGRGGGGKGGKLNSNDTAPPLEECKPLEVNEETRWKAKVMDGGNKENNQTEAVESKDEILCKATLILNKLSLTKFDKLSDEFIGCGIGRDVNTLMGAVGLIVNYAQEQQHFSSMYAGLCLKLANTPLEGIDEGSTKKGKKFKKILLERCQIEFETDTATKIKEATKDITDEEEIEYHANIIKKRYLGHMRFIGELYKGDLISIKIMLFCLPALLKGENEQESLSDEVDEEKVECFSKLMTVIGSSLEQQSEAMRSVGKADAADNLSDCWRTVEIMAGRRKEEEGPKVSNRIKFMLQDLLEMKEKGWVMRRKEETAKTIAQIHKEVAKEERAAARRSSSSASLRGMSKGGMRRGASSGDVRIVDKQQSNKPHVDEDGFVSVPASQRSFSRSSSMTAIRRSQSEGFHKYSTRGSMGPSVGRPEGSGSRRPSQGKFAILSESHSRKNSKKESSGGKQTGEKAASPLREEKPADDQTKKPKIDYPTPSKCGDKAKNILKEYFVGGDTDDAVLSIHELVGVGNEGSAERGTKVVESAVLLVLEMKAEEVDKFLTVYLRCAKEKKIMGESFVLGLNDPLEFLSDVAIDAPLALPHMVNIVAELVKAGIIPLEFLLDAPDYFRTDQYAAVFGAKVMKKIGGDAITKEEYIEVVEKLMTDEDKAKHSSAADLITET